VPRPVVLDWEVVEACRLDSKAGTAIVLLNWTDDPLAALTVTVPGGAEFTRVSTARRVKVQSSRQGNQLRVTLPLEHVDVLLLEP